MAIAAGTGQHASVAIDLVFETHSTSEDNARGIATGWLPGRLSATGRDQARAMGDRRRASTDVVFCSDLARAVTTATIAFEDSRIPIQLDRRLRECDYGDLNGAPVAEVHARRAEHVETPFPNGQSYRDCVEQVRSFLADLARDHDGERVLLVGHTATRWALDHLLNGVALETLVRAPFEWREGWSYSVGSTPG